MKKAISIEAGHGKDFRYSCNGIYCLDRYIICRC